MKRRIMGAVAVTAIALCLGAPAQAAKTLVYCSEGSPENFNPQINTTGTSFDTAYPVFNRLVEFEPGTTKLMPALAESWDVSDDGLSYTFHLRKGVKFHPGRQLYADPRLQRRRRDRHLQPHVEGRPSPTPRFPAAPMTISTTWACRTCWSRSTRSTKTPSSSSLKQAGVAVHRQPRAWTSRPSIPRNTCDAMLKAGTPEMVDQVPVGTGPFIFVQLREGCDDPLQGQRELLRRQAADRQPGLLDHPGSGGAHAEAAGGRVRRGALSGTRPICRCSSRTRTCKC